MASSISKVGKWVNYAYSTNLNQGTPFKRPIFFLKFPVILPYSALKPPTFFHIFCLTTLAPICALYSVPVWINGRNRLNIENWVSCWGQNSRLQRKIAYSCAAKTIVLTSASTTQHCQKEILLHSPSEIINTAGKTGHDARWKRKQS